MHPHKACKICFLQNVMPICQPRDNVVMIVLQRPRNFNHYCEQCVFVICFIC